MKNKTNQPELNLPSDAPANSTATKLDQRLERFRQAQAIELRRLEKSRDRARFTIGELILDDSTIWAQVSPLISDQLATKDSAGHVASYGNTIAALAKIRSMRV